MNVFIRSDPPDRIHQSIWYTDALPRQLRRFIQRLIAPRETHALASAALDIPAAFLEDQARFVLALKDLGVERNDATWLLWVSPARFSKAQVRCILDMLGLDTRDFCATLGDAMAPCTLRGQLLRGRGFKDEEVCRLRRQVALEVDHLRRAELA